MIDAILTNTLSAGNEPPHPQLPARRRRTVARLQSPAATRALSTNSSEAHGRRSGKTMEVYNRTPYLWFPTTGMDVAGREYFTLVIKASFRLSLPIPTIRPRPLSEQVPFVTADHLHRRAGLFRNTLWETDFAFRKSQAATWWCRVPPMPRTASPPKRFRSGCVSGNGQKVFMSSGHREWLVVGPTISATKPHPFTRQAFSATTPHLEVLTGSNPDDPKPPAYQENPAGRGYACTQKSVAPDRCSPCPRPKKSTTPVTSPLRELIGQWRLAR